MYIWLRDHVINVWFVVICCFLQLCLNMDPSERPSCTQLLRHAFFTKDNFAEKFTSELKTKIAREVADNPLLQAFSSSRQEKDGDDRARRKEKKSKKVIHHFSGVMIYNFFFILKLGLNIVILVNKTLGKRF